MTKIDLDHFRQRLLERQAELQSVEEIGHEAAATVELDQSAVGRLSRMDAMQAQAVSQEMEQRRTLELQRIKAALARIESGDYGYCLRCDEPINPHRLEIDPSATLCIQCAEKS
ncbi:hypothetical protein BOW53_12270 [Solemya pervernicosa gill symbiont]|uniref:Zinc finger DksA/TraR C4-type domain-containing protein n=1 Tax=Solemya pervernicosa gill symbiont TaxID=642797 RepID=A0A1T2L2N2_9GAMM|nr:TraR/DksA family transcriptional regulator [Solemya pervernicosa gill symbiont]OOZ39324.1 hypothetical protein BOW53_12270 [Solemya pervernicosa gill symbiont]